jgi:type II secretory ATPase GspE/PulE/Tfp pilus assembly ATPase PilB-like protein
MNRTTRYLKETTAEGTLEVPVLVNQIILDAVEAGASDIHIEPWESTIAVRLRLNGVLTELAHLPKALLDRISARFKVLANLVSYQSDLPQDGHVPADPQTGDVELRISVFPTVRGEKVVARLFDPRNRSFELDELGFEEETLAAFKQLLARPSGLILLTGPTGSGKTTAIYSALSHILERMGPSVSISTIEDPVEYNLPMVSQGQINPLKDFTYPVALRALLRQDPQVIMVGEIRDPETATIALQAGLTGHLVISTIHSAGSAGVFARLINMDLEPFLLASSVIGVLSMRLIRKNCEFCAQPYHPASALLRNLAAEDLAKATFRQGGGCGECHQTGYASRTAITELLLVNEAVREAILQKMPTRALQKVAIEQGMQTLWSMGLRRVFTGQCPLEELIRIVAVDEL